MEYLTPERAADLLPVGNADWVREQLRAGKLHGVKIGGRWFTTREDIDDMLERAQNFKRRRRRRQLSS